MDDNIKQNSNGLEEKVLQSNGFADAKSEDKEVYYI